MSKIMRSFKKNNSDNNSKNSRMGLGKTVSQCDLKQLLLLIFFLICILCDIFILKINLQLNFMIKWYYRLAIAVPIFFLAILIAKQSISVIYYKIHTPPIIVDWGPFRYSRHPMYLSALLLYLAFIILSSSILGLFLYSIVVLFYAYLARFEEKYLIHQFQEEYLTYQNKVSKWIDFRRIFDFNFS